MLGLHKVKLALVVSTMTLTMALALPALASADCSTLMGHNAAVYRYTNGTGYIKTKYAGEYVSGPQWEEDLFDWEPAGVTSPYVTVNYGGSYAYMNWDEINSGADTCGDPW